VSQISQAEASDLLGKLFTERIPLQAFLFSSHGTRVSFFGFVDSITRDTGVIVSARGAPIDLSRGYFNFVPFDRNCEFWYGEKRELPVDLQTAISETRGDSCLLFVLSDSGERVGLFFTL
jgi:hypothetical protein